MIAVSRYQDPAVLNKRTNDPVFEDGPLLRGSVGRLSPPPPDFLSDLYSTRPCIIQEPQEKVVRFDEDPLYHTISPNSSTSTLTPGAATHVLPDDDPLALLTAPEPAPRPTPRRGHLPLPPRRSPTPHEVPPQSEAAQVLRDLMAENLRPASPAPPEAQPNADKALETGAPADYFRPSVLSAVAKLKVGSWFQVFREGVPPEERYFDVRSVAEDDELDLGESKLALCESERPKASATLESLPISSLVGVQRGAGSPAFSRFLRKDGYVEGVSTEKMQALLPPRYCFTLWFKTGTAYQSVDLAAADEEIHRTWVGSLEVLRSINTSANYTNNSNTAALRSPPQSARPRWVRKKGAKGAVGCAIL